MFRFGIARSPLLSQVSQDAWVSERRKKNRISQNILCNRYIFISIMCWCLLCQNNAIIVSFSLLFSSLNYLSLFLQSQIKVYQCYSILLVFWRKASQFLGFDNNNHHHYYFLNLQSKNREGYTFPKFCVFIRKHFLQNTFMSSKPIQNVCNDICTNSRAHSFSLSRSLNITQNV